MARRFNYIPSNILAEDRRRKTANAWAQQQRAPLAQSWAQNAMSEFNKWFQKIGEQEVQAEQMQQPSGDMFSDVAQNYGMAEWNQQQAQTEQEQKGLELIGEGQTWLDENVTKPLGETAVYLGSRGAEGVSPLEGREAQARSWNERPEAFPTQKFIEEAAVDPFNIIPFDEVARGAKAAAPLVKKGLEAAKPALKAFEEVATGPTVRRLAPGLTIEDVSKLPSAGDEALAKASGESRTVLPSQAQSGISGPELLEPSQTIVQGSSGRQLSSSSLTNIPPKPPAGNTLQGNLSPTGPISYTGPTRKTFWSQAWDRSRNIIARQGESGKELAGMVEKARDNGEIKAGSWLSRMPTVTKLGKIEFDNFVDVAEGKAGPITTKVADAVSEWSNVRQEIYNDAKLAGLEIGQIQDYFPHMFNPDMFKDKNRWAEAVNHLVKTGQAADAGDAARKLRFMQDKARTNKYGNLEFEREFDIPGYEKTKEALVRYIEGSADRIGAAEVLGVKAENAYALLPKIADEGFDATAAEKHLRISTGMEPGGEYQNKVSGAIRGYNAITRLGLSAISNASQSLNTATVTGGMRTLAAIPKALTPEARDFSLKAGVTLDSVIADLREGFGLGGKIGKLTSPGFNEVEKFNRTVAAWAGKNWADELGQQALKGDQKAVKQLEKMDLNAQDIIKRNGVLTEAEQIQAARNIVKRTQFKVDPQDLPGWASSPYGRLVLQFRTFSYNQSAFMMQEIVKPALEGNFAPLIRFTAYGLPAGATITELRNLLQARDSEEDPMKRVIQYYQRVGGIGLAGDVMTALNPQNADRLDPYRRASMAMNTLGGPTAGLTGDALAAAAAAQGGHPENIERFALRQIPIVGTSLQNTLLPYQKQEGSGSPGRDDIREALREARRSSKPSPERVPRPGR